ncbi:MAG: hypothetical protein J6B53_15155 [Clostridia bacterium]|nr:hypothetical protein [Clostridia bacterium]
MMELQDVYITQLCIRKVRHLKDIMIPVSSPEKPDKKHLIITGKTEAEKQVSWKLLHNISIFVDPVSTRDVYLDLQESLDRKSAFAQIKRDYIRMHMDLYPGLSDILT